MEELSQDVNFSEKFNAPRISLICLMDVLCGYPFSLPFIARLDAKKIQDEHYKLSATCFERSASDKNNYYYYYYSVSRWFSWCCAFITWFGHCHNIVIYMSQS
jgi:hypothetical protein